jgi:hypothetical protein
MDGEKLVAACGLYCGACEMYRADHDDNEKKMQELAKSFSARGGQVTVEDLKCDGCLGQGKLTPWCRQCDIRSCSKHQAGQTLCSDCADFPCARVTAFNNDGMQHHTEVLDNLRQLKKMGLTDWVKHEESRWTCPQCQTSLSWYDKACPQCGAKRSERLFSLKQE